MLTLVDLRGYTGNPLERLPRAAVDREAARDSVRVLVADVRANGDLAVHEASERFGGSPHEPSRITGEQVVAASENLAPELFGALQAAADRIRAYHEAQLSEERAPWWRIGPDGMRVGEETRPLRRVGCYVPGGRAAYPSTALMTVLPAVLAGVEEVVACVPGAPDGSGISPATLAALGVAGATEVYECGGAQAVAAMAYGTETIPRVDKIVGPGSLWVALAKHEVALDVGVDSFAGPTEVAIIADGSVPAAFIAADLVAQAEHDPLATPLLITWDEDVVRAVEDALAGELDDVARREDVEAALKGQGAAVVVDDLEHAIAVANAFAPEHLELCIADAESALPKIRTAGAARFASPLRVADFIKSTAVIQFDRAGVETVAPALLAVARAEGLTAHARAIEMRLT
ncbi:MAG: histidinol dehydrogenase [Actinomycetota bacterium]